MGPGSQGFGSQSRLNVSRLSNTETLPDPRETAAAANHPLLAAAAQTDDGALPAALQQALVAGDDNGIRAALGVQPPASAQRVARMLAAAHDAHGNGIGLRFFAIPLVIVAGARKPCTVQGALPEVHVLRGLLEQHGAIGVTRNFGLGNARLGRSRATSSAGRVATRTDQGRR